MKISEYFGAALLFITVATQCESLSNIHITGTAIRISQSSNDYSVMEDGFLVVHCDVQLKNVPFVFISIGQDSTYICYLNRENFKFNKSEGIGDRCHEKLFVKVDEKKLSDDIFRLSFSFGITWSKLFSGSLQRFYTCRCELSSTIESWRQASLHMFDWLEPPIIKYCELNDYYNVNCEWKWDNQVYSSHFGSTILRQVNISITYKSTNSTFHQLCRRRATNKTHCIGTIETPYNKETNKFEIQLSPQLQIKFLMEFPQWLNLQSLSKENINVSMNKDNSTIIFSHPWKREYIYQLGKDNLTPGKPRISACEHLKNIDISGTSTTIPVQPSKNFLKVKHHYDVELNLYCKLSSNEVAVLDKKTVYVITGNEDSCGFCKFENLAPATNYSVFMSLIGTDNGKEYGKSSENTVYTFTTNTTEPEALPETFYYIQNGIKPSVVIIWNPLSKRQRGGKTTAYKITLKEDTAKILSDIMFAEEPFFYQFNSKLISETRPYAIRVESTWKKDNTFDFSSLKERPDQIALPVNWSKKQPKNLLVTAYIDRHPLRLVVLWSEWALNAAEYILLLCRNQDSFLNGCKTNLEIFKISRGENVYEHSIDSRSLNDFQKNFSIAIALKLEENFMSGLIFSPCVFKNKVRLHGTRGEDNIERITTIVKGEMFQAIVKLRKSPCDLDVFFMYIIVYFCISKDNVCIGDVHFEKKWLGKSISIQYDLNISAKNNILLWANVGSHVDESTNTTAEESLGQISEEIRSNVAILVVGVASSIALTIAFSLFFWKLRAVLKKCVHFPISRNLREVRLHSVSSNHPDVRMNNELPNGGVELLLGSTETGNESEKNTDETNLTYPQYIAVHHLEDSNGYISNEVSFFNDIKRPPSHNGNLPRDNLNVSGPGPNNSEKSGEIFIGEGLLSGSVPANLFQLNADDSVECMSSQPVVVSGYVDPSYFSRGN
ncbi:DgyrCDS13360 [Dimorphilus gyrociliatus]|uniref:DgyrCDS13360 n=1 Tax=Dimorphilus gyrociliatus TaxID=2664684 RepID=A0A7I8WAF4_9ANNE|nr:DgyrCDS13360 [Dimorphilus gyrociliatus]